MIAAGDLETPRPAAIFALHTFPQPVGQVALACGRCMAGVDEFRVRLYSPAGDLEQLMAKAASALRALSTAKPPAGTATFDRLVHAMEESSAPGRAVLVSCWPYTGGGHPTYHLLILASSTKPAIRARVHAQIQHTLKTVTDEMGATFDLHPTFYNPPLVNDAALVKTMMPIIETIVGSENLHRFKSPHPFVHEDFALYLDHIPGALLWLGILNPAKGITHLLHHANFDIDEEALVLGTRLAATLLWHAGQWVQP